MVPMADASNSFLRQADEHWDDVVVKVKETPDGIALQSDSMGRLSDLLVNCDTLVNAGYGRSCGTSVK